MPGFTPHYCHYYYYAIYFDTLPMPPAAITLLDAAIERCRHSRQAAFMPSSMPIAAADA